SSSARSASMVRSSAAALLTAFCWARRRSRSASKFVTILKTRLVLAPKDALQLGMLARCGRILCGTTLASCPRTARRLLSKVRVSLSLDLGQSVHCLVNFLKLLEIFGD